MSKYKVQISIDGREVKSQTFDTPEAADLFATRNLRKLEGFGKPTFNIEHTNDAGNATSKASAFINERGEIELMGVDDVIHSEEARALIVPRVVTYSVQLEIDGEMKPISLSEDEAKKLVEDLRAQGFGRK